MSDPSGESVPATEGGRKHFRGLVMSGHPDAARDNRHEHDHWYIAEECDLTGCRPRDAEAPVEEPRVTADTVVVERSLTDSGGPVGADDGT